MPAENRGDVLEGRDKGMVPTKYLGTAWVEQEGKEKGSGNGSRTMTSRFFKASKQTPLSHICYMIPTFIETYEMRYLTKQRKKKKQAVGCEYLHLFILFYLFHHVYGPDNVSIVCVFRRMLEFIRAAATVKS